VLACLGSSALLRSPRPEPLRELPDANANASSTPTGRHWTNAISETRREAQAAGARRRSRQGRVSRRRPLPREDLDALVVHLRYPSPPTTVAQHEPAEARSRGQTPHKGDGTLPRRDQLPHLVWAVLDLLITHQTNGINFNALDRHASSERATKATSRTIPEEATAA